MEESDEEPRSSMVGEVSLDSRLEGRLEEIFVKLGISGSEREILRSHLDLLKVLPEHYNHSINLSILGVDIAEYLGLDVLRVFRAFLLHDVGKIEDPSLFGNHVWDGNGFENLRKKPHPHHSWRIIRGSYPFEAEVVKIHHRHQKNDPYPIGELVFPLNFSPEECKIIIHYSEVLAVADSYDARTNRDNRRYNGVISGDEAREFLLEEFPRQRDLIEMLYSGGVLGDS